MPKKRDKRKPVSAVIARRPALFEQRWVIIVSGDSGYHASYTGNVLKLLIASDGQGIELLLRADGIDSDNEQYLQQAIQHPVRLIAAFPYVV